MSEMQSTTLTPRSAARPRCPQCQAPALVQRATPARSGFEHWTLRCTKCGHIHEAQVQAVLKGIADHVGAMDIAPRLVEDIRKAPEDKITWLDTSALDATKLRTDAFHGEHLVETRHIRDYEITSSGQATQPDIPPRFMPNDRYDPNRVTFAIKARLARLKCEPGTVDDKWDANARQALQRLAAASREGFLTGAPVRETLYRLQDWEGVACDGRCPSGAAPSGDAPPSQSCRAPEAQTEALPSAGAMSSLEVAVGSDKILLPVPEGYCLLDSTRRVDALMLSLMTSFPATPKLRLVAMVAECGGLKRWRAGDGPLGAYVQYFVDLRYEATPLVDTTQEFVRSACTQLKTSLPLELADTTRSMNERIARATNDIRVYPRAPIGFFDEDGLSCVGVALQNVQSDMGISKLLLETSAIVVVKQRVIYSRRFALYEGHRTVVTRAIEVQRALAGAALRLNAL